MFDAITAVSLQGVLNAVTDLVPIVLPVMIGYIAFRKGWAFIQSTLYNA